MSQADLLQKCLSKRYHFSCWFEKFDNFRHVQTISRHLWIVSLKSFIENILNSNCAQYVGKIEHKKHFKVSRFLLRFIWKISHLLQQMYLIVKVAITPPLSSHEFENIKRNVSYFLSILLIQTMKYFKLFDILERFKVAET